MKVDYETLYLEKHISIWEFFYSILIITLFSLKVFRDKSISIISKLNKILNQLKILLHYHFHVNLKTY